jgi:transposase
MRCEWLHRTVYKTAEYGMIVEQVDPESTSRRYSTCGFTHIDNRESEEFEWIKCGYENHTDYYSYRKSRSKPTAWVVR